MNASLVLVVVVCATLLSACTTTPVPSRLAMSSPSGGGQFPGCRYQCSDLNF
jgi:hypothetical protein